MWCGVDIRPLLPLALTLSTVAGMVELLMVQVPLEARLYGLWPEATWYYITIPVYAVTLICLAWSALVDPGQLPKNYERWLDSDEVDKSLLAVESADAEESDQPDDAGVVRLPKRAHKCWQYQRPVRRYDHYCRWLTNVIGLYNHRQFLVMVIGLVLIAFMGIFRDVALLVALYEAHELGYDAIFIAAHMVYSLGLLSIAYPILRIHVGLISRNEVAQEWKRNIHYVVRESKAMGNNVPVNALSDNEFNEKFDDFVYDGKKNPFDKGTVWKNCFQFWSHKRGKKELGVF